VSFGAAIKSCLNQYAGFSGRARRSEYWFFALFGFLVYLVAAVLLAAPVGIGRTLGFLAVLGLVLPALAVTVRRLHDTGRSGAWVLLNLIPFGGIVTLIFICMDSQPHPNQYGPSPKPGVPGWQVGYGQQANPPAGYGQPTYGQDGSHSFPPQP
jgi:uncharacterized membrane protein YhaH (DUF805 family)